MCVIVKAVLCVAVCWNDLRKSDAMWVLGARSFTAGKMIYIVCVAAGGGWGWGTVFSSRSSPLQIWASIIIDPARAVGISYRSYLAGWGAVRRPIYLLKCGLRRRKTYYKASHILQRIL